jgi:hypothetical protein
MHKADIMATQQEESLFVESEDNGRPLLQTKVEKEHNYQKQQGTGMLNEIKVREAQKLILINRDTDSMDGLGRSRHGIEFPRSRRLRLSMVRDAPLRL